MVFVTVKFIICSFNKDSGAAVIIVVFVTRTSETLNHLPRPILHQNAAISKLWSCSNINDDTSMVQESSRWQTDTHTPINTVPPSLCRRWTGGKKFIYCVHLSMFASEWRLIWMAAYLGYTLRMRTLFRGWPIMVNDTHTRRRRRMFAHRSVYHVSG